MSDVDRTTDGLILDGVPLAAIADAVGTPAYVYSASTIRDRFARLDGALGSYVHRIHYSLKANSCRAVLDVIRSSGGAADVVSGGELHRALAAGFSPRDIVFGGVGKTRAEIRQAIDAGILMISVESVAEVRLVSEEARSAGVRASISLRVNPEVTVDAGHEYIKTGGRGHKFGIPHDDVLSAVRCARDCGNVDIIGLGMHLGSQLSRLDPYREATTRLVALVAAMRADGVTSLAYLDVGGGLGVRYDREPLVDLSAFASMLLPIIAPTGLSLIMEPGRFLVANAGLLLTTVLYRKHSGGREYVIVDAGMTELLRPSHYGAYHRVDAVGNADGSTEADVVGPVCESGDFLALGRPMADVHPGDRLAVMDTGAYGSVMASSYNSRLRAPEVLVDGGRFAVVTARETYADLTRLEVASPEWRNA